MEYVRVSIYEYCITKLPYNIVAIHTKHIRGNRTISIPEKVCIIYRYRYVSQQKTYDTNDARVKCMDTWNEIMRKKASAENSIKLVGTSGAAAETYISFTDGSNVTCSHGLLSSQRVPSINICREGKTSRMSHSKSGMESLYFLHSCWRRLSLPLFSDRKSPAAGPRPTDTSSNDGTFSSRANIWPIAYLSTRNRCAYSGDVMRTWEVAVQTIFPEHCRCTCLF